MKIFALSDFHLSFAVDKPMNIFGENWQDYESEIQKNWNAVVGPDAVEEDVVHFVPFTIL